MVKYLMVNFMHEQTQKEMIRLFMLVSTDYHFNKFLLNNGIVVRSIDEVDVRLWIGAPKEKKIVIFTGEEVLK